MESPRPQIARNARTEPIRFTELLSVLRLRKKLVYFFIATTLAGAIFRQIFYIPTYTASTKLNIQQAENNPLQAAVANLNNGSQFESPDKIQKYIAYVSSSEFFLAVAQQLKFQDGYQLLNLTVPSEMGLTHKKFWKAFIASNFGAQKKAQQSDEAPLEPVLVPVEKLALIVQAMVSAEEVGTDGIRIRATTMDAFTSMVLANTASEVFVKKTGERDYNEVAEVKRFIQQQLESTTERLKQSELALVEFKKRHNIISINAEQTAFSGKLSTIENDLSETRIKYEENLKLADFYTRALQKNETRLLQQGSAAFRSSRADLINRLRQQVDALRYKKVLMQAQGYTEDSWQMSELNGEIDKVAEQLKGELAKGQTDDDEPMIVNLDQARAKLAQLKNENKSLEAKIASIEKTRSDLLKSLESLPKDEQVLLTLNRDVDLQFELYSSLKKKLQEVEIQQVALQSHVLISQRSDMPPPAPRTNFLVKILFSLLIGLFLGGCSAFVLEAMDPTVKHVLDLEGLELISLGSIPHVEGSQIRQTLGRQSYRPDLLICKEKPESPEGMAFKQVRAQLANLRGSDGKPAKVIAITSPEAGDGKSFVAANLATCLAQLERKIAVLDCDFRNPSLPWLFGYHEGVGLSSLLTLKASFDDILIRDVVPRLDLLPAGWTPQSPTELVSNDKFRVLLEHLRSLYDFVIIDCPPANSIVDAAVISSLADAVVLAAGYRKTRKDALLQALRRILQLSHKSVYAVLNNVWEIKHRGAYSYADGAHPERTEKVDARAELAQFEKVLKRKAG